MDTATVAINGADLEPVRAVIDAAAALNQAVEDLQAFIPREVNPIVLVRAQLDPILEASKAFDDAIGAMRFAPVEQEGTPA